MKDLRDGIKGRKALVLTNKREDATIVLVVMGRTSTWQANTARVKLIFKDFEAEMSSASQLSETRAAKGLAKQVEEWVIANRAKLTEAAR